ncbi:hypothetical protein [Tateyamaria sp.]|uniref:hypothetical protein n=1 Tax=Tateyamaria sp. TaxID=1929288 RepID=UPI00329FF886
MTRIGVETDASADQFLSGQSFDDLVRVSELVFSEPIFTVPIYVTAGVGYLMC